MVTAKVRMVVIMIAVNVATWKSGTVHRRTVLVFVVRFGFTFATVTGPWILRNWKRVGVG